MINIKDYIVDTGGVLPPEDVVNNRLVFIKSKKKLARISLRTVGLFKCLDDDLIKFKYNARNIMIQEEYRRVLICSSDVFILGINDLGLVLYE